ncbi:hypothetical protein [Silvibacterium dinghuense]|uniref:Uncharacterized protein n=1 Tax=Silvibacterium dinghuense TaxID=1560006 RepID=A0A4Q1SHE6_9BACT|nr:hypothetical protein [Silvibacterium dinghuense]RXS96998.1 hypothetical protein ESZ00_03425 [Silvibacterium dinghuense]GGG95348.1 hypothetical protein GCM10011586_07970 [Silvibacterium dinghuense]
MPEPAISELEFLSEGLKSYPQALAALRDFRESIVTRCRASFDLHFDQIARAMGEKLVKTKIEIRRKPDRIESSDVDGVTADLGVRLKSQGWRVYHNVTWEQGNKAAACFSIWVSDGNRANDIYAKIGAVFESTKFELTGPQLSPNEVCLGFAIHDGAEIENALDAVCKEWIRIWTEIGGLSKISTIP